MNSKGSVCAYFKVVSSGRIEKSYERPLVHAEILLQSLHNMKKKFLFLICTDCMVLNAMRIFKDNEGK
jgi:hypothetical protein